MNRYIFAAGIVSVLAMAAIPNPDLTTVLFTGVLSLIMSASIIEVFRLHSDFSRIEILIQFSPYTDMIALSLYCESFPEDCNAYDSFL